MFCWLIRSFYKSLYMHIQAYKKFMQIPVGYALAGYVLVLLALSANAQSRVFLQAWQRFRQLPQLMHASISMEVMDASSGQVVFQYQSQVGLAPASCNKVFTAAAALERLGPGFRYKTLLAYRGIMRSHTFIGNLYLIGGGDPTLGSWRFPSSTPENIWKRWITLLRSAGIAQIQGNIVGVDHIFSTQMIPGGWVWEDIGNYYGAGCAALNWHENQFDIALQPGAHVGDAAHLVAVKHQPGGLSGERQLQIVNELLTGEAGSGDQAYVFFDLTRPVIFLRGTVPLDAPPDFTIAASVPDPVLYAAEQLRDTLLQAGIIVNGHAEAVHLHDSLPSLDEMTILDQVYSPPLDSVIYAFLHRSINLYGEALVLTLSSLEHLPATRETGLEVIHRFCRQIGIDSTAVNTVDGSGLSPANRVTAHALATLLYQVQHKSWFNDFYEALPVIHDIRMKDGYIAGVRSYAGYIQDRKGKKWIFAFIVNNFTGSAGKMRDEMWKVLDAIKHSQPFTAK